MSDERERIEAWLKAVNADKAAREFLEDLIKSLGDSDNIEEWLMANEHFINALPEEPFDSSGDSKPKAPVVPVDSSKIDAWLKAHEKPEIHIDYAKPSAPIPVGASKIGGCPDVPAGFVWPRYEGGDNLESGREGLERPLSFLAQFDLAEVAPFDKDGLLPKTGHLAFFYDNEGVYDGGMCWEGLGARVFYFPSGTALARMEIPDDMGEDADIPELALTFSTRTSRPTMNDWPYELQDEAGSADYEEQNDAEQGCKIFGNPYVIQNPMEQECQLCLMDLEWGAQDAPETRDAVRAGMNDWILLLQLDSLYVKKYADVMFGYDSGALYFWIRKQDLAAGDFGKVCQLLQYC